MRVIMLLHGQKELEWGRYTGRTNAQEVRRALAGDPED